MDIFPDSEYKDPRRLPLLQKIADYFDHPYVTVDTWSTLWTCDIEKLQGLVSELDLPASYGAPYLNSVRDQRFLHARLIKPWLLKVRETSAASTSQAASATSSHQQASSSPPTPENAPRGTTHQQAFSSLPSSTFNTPAKFPRDPIHQQVTGFPPSLTFSTPEKANLNHTRQQTSSVPPSSTFGTPAKVTRDPTIVGPARDRDCGCVVTKALGEKCVEVAHIYPISMSKHLHPRSQLWILLRSFFSDEDMQSWENALFSSRKTERLENLLTLSLTAHKAWDTCQFAFLPLATNASRTEMKVRFFWLKVRPRGTGPISLVTIPDLPSDYPTGQGNLKLWDCNTELKINSGDVLTLTTHNPITHPLPSEAILRMQWHLNRIAALSGGVEALEEISYHDYEEPECAIEDEYDYVGDDYEDIRPPSPTFKAPSWSATLAHNTMAH